MDYLIQQVHWNQMKEDERATKSQIVRQLRLERSLKNNSVEQKVVERQIISLTRKLDDILEHGRK